MEWDSSNVKPCPFCGEENEFQMSVLKPAFSRRKEYAIVCGNCKIKGNYGDSPVEALYLWNECAKEEKGINKNQQKVVKCFRDLMNFVPEGRGILKDISRIIHGKYFEQTYREGDEECPLFSEAYLYNLLGKEDARTVFGLLRSLAESIDIDIDTLEDEE